MFLKIDTLLCHHLEPIDSIKYTSERKSIYQKLDYFSRLTKSLMDIVEGTIPTSYRFGIYYSLSPGIIECDY